MSSAGIPNIGAAGREQFRNIIVVHRNHDILTMMTPLMLFREEVVNSEDLQDRGGLTSPAQRHFLMHLKRCDQVRRLVTHNPEDKDLGTLIEEAVDVNLPMTEGAKPAASDGIQHGATSEYVLPWAFDGSDWNVPLLSQLLIPSGHGTLLLAGIDALLVAITQMNSTEMSHHITRFDSLRMYELMCRILTALLRFGGDENRIDVAQMRATDHPRGPQNAPNRRTETPGVSGSASHGIPTEGVATDQSGGTTGGSGFGL